jgi:hypothetical protein
MAINKISGNTLQDNLQRGSNLTFQTDLLVVDVTNQRIGVNTATTTHVLTVAGNLSAGNIDAANINITDGIFANTVNVSGNSVFDGITISGNGLSAASGKIELGSAANVSITGGSLGFVLVTDGAGNLDWTSTSNITGVLGNLVDLGTPSAGNLVSNAVTLTANTTVTDGIAQLNVILGKLVPPSPPSFPGANTLTITTATTSARMCSGFTQPDNTPAANKAVAAGTLVSVIRGSSYSTSTISNTGPGDSGTLTVNLNGTGAGNVTFNTGANPTANGTYSNLVVTNNYDYNVANASIAAGFWYVFSSRAAGVVPSGWNEVGMTHSTAGSTNTPSWYYDSSTVAAPQFTNTSILPTSNSFSYTSTIPHYTSSTQFTIGFDVNRLSANMYPNSSNLTSATVAGGSFAAPAAITYAAAGISTPLAQNLYANTGAVTTSTTVAITTGFGSSGVGPSISVTNSYNTGSNTFTPTATILRKTGNATAVDEGNVVVTNVGTGSGNAVRIVNPGSGNTPAYTASATAFDSQNGPLQTYDAVVVGSGSQGVLRHDQTNYSTGYLPVGPDLSVGRSGTQYFTIEFVRTDVSKFDIRYSGNVAGMWVALPGSAIDSSSGANGWIDMTVAYAGSGYPGVNAPGNGSDGCSLGGVVQVNTTVANASKTCTFGTVSSSSTATNEIYVRIALTSGQSVTALSLQQATN